MSLTKKDKEEIKVIIREVLGNQKDKPAEYIQKDLKYIFQAWSSMSNDTNINTRIELAPEDFVLEEDFKLKDGTILKKGKRYFTYDEAMALEKELFEPNGWRLPTVEEFMILYVAYGLNENGEDDPKALHEALKLETQGYITTNDMDEYNNDPENFENNGGTVNGRTTDGYWWSRNASSSAYANYLYTFISGSSGNVNAQGSLYRGYGFSVRCVAR